MTTTPTARKTLRKTTQDAMTSAMQSAKPVVSRIPEMKYYTSYISREVFGVPDFEVLDHAFDVGKNVLIYGPTGPGKTSFALAWSALRERRFASVPSNIAIEPTQLFGKMSRNTNGVWDWYDGTVTDVVRHGGTLLFNEVNFMPAQVASSVFGLLDKRREITLVDHQNEIVRAHRQDCWCSLPDDECRKRWVLVIADMNPNYSGTRKLNEALRNRFAIQIPWDYDSAVEERLITSPKLLEIIQNIRSMGARIDTPTTTNMAQEFIENATGPLGLDFAIANFVAHYDIEEQGGVRQAFDNVADALKADFLPEANDWDQFINGKDDWMDMTKPFEDGF